MSNYKQIALIGAGQLGSRHLQGLMQMDGGAKISVFDPSEESLKIAESRAREISSSRKEVSYFSSWELTPDHFDLAIIATSSMVRLKAIKDLLQNADTSNLILEKILFTSISEYREAEKLIENIPTWVNCPRRLNTAYIQLADVLKGYSNLKYTVTGKGYGLACVAIHFIDIFSMLCGELDYSLDTSELIPDVFKSKREGYIEFYGKLTSHFSKGNQLVMDCMPSCDGSVDFSVRIETDGLAVVIDEIRNLTDVLIDEKNLLGDFSFKTLFQSSMTGNVANEILSGGKCGLTTYKESVKLHIPLIENFSEFVQTLGKTVERLNIT